MITAALVLAAVAVMFKDQLLEQLRRAAESGALKSVNGTHVVAGLLLAVAACTWFARPTDGEPTPAPPAPESFTLRGAFVGPGAADDAATTQAMCEEIAAELEWDGMQAAPLFTTGVSFDELRVRMINLMCRGEKLGDKHPRARAAIEAYLNEHAGTAGGPFTPEVRSQWIAAYRDVARAAEDAAR